MRQVLSLATSVNTLWAMWLLGRKHWWGWVVGLCNQTLWFTTIVLFKVWGLLPLSVALTVIYTRNLIVWRREHQAAGVWQEDRIDHEFSLPDQESFGPGRIHLDTVTNKMRCWTGEHWIRVEH